MIPERNAVKKWLKAVIVCAAGLVLIGLNSTMLYYSGASNDTKVWEPFIAGLLVGLVGIMVFTVWSEA